MVTRLALCAKGMVILWMENYWLSLRRSSNLSNPLEGTSLLLFAVR